MKTRNRITLSVIGIVAILLITIGLSYAYFSANLTGGEEATTITVTGGTMNIVYDGGANINVANIIPSASPVATKIFTVTGNNTTDIDMGYKISIVIDSNTFSEEALKYKLISTNTDNNGTVVPSINELTNIGTGPKTIELGNGTFEVPTGGNKVHTYSLEIYFPNANYNQNEDQGKEFKAHIKTESINYLEYDAEKGVNKPQLATGMVPIKWDGNNWVSTTSNDPDWYDYNNKKWANIATLDNSKLFDYSDNKHGGTINGAVQQEDGIYFDGEDDYIIINGTENVNLSQNATMAIRVKINSFVTNQYSQNNIFGNWEGGGGGFYLDINNYISFQIHINNQYVSVRSTFILNLNQYYTIVGTYDGNNIKLYIDGQLNNSIPATGNINPSPIPFVVAANLDLPTSFNRISNITVSHVSVYNAVLSESQVSNDFSNIPRLNKINLLFGYDLRKTKDIEPGIIMNIENLSTMWVWIPRYAYKILSGYHSNEAGEFDIIFLKEKTLDNDDKVTIETRGYNVETKNTSQHYFLHPSFNQGEEEIAGYWVAKFEATADEGVVNGFTSDSSCPNNEDNVTTKTVKFIPNVISWRCINTKNAYTVITEMKNKKETYGWYNNEINPHMMTNLEWGAVVYLIQSKYGANQKIWNNAYNQYKTGCSGSEISASNENTCIEYNTENGVKASTTSNIYGIYDINGGAWEKVMATYNNLPSEYSGFTETELINLPNSHISRYTTLTNKLLNNIGMDYDLSVYGDAIYETSNGAQRYNGTGWIGTSYGSWYNGWSRLPHTTFSWLGRGGFFTGTAHSIFNFYINNGNPYSNDSFRATLFVNS